MATPRLVKDIRAGSSGSKITGLTTVGNALYFQANDGVSGYELWKHDSSSLETGFEKTFGTALVKDIQPGQIDNGAFGGISPKGSFPSALTAVGSILYFSADDGVNGLELWKSDGTADGTTLVANINTSNSFPTKGTSIGNTLFFTAVSTQGRELMRTGGTPASTAVVKDIIADKFNVPGDYFSSNPNHLTAIGNTLYFTATDLFAGRELWRSDGTEEGTLRLKDIVLGAQGSSPSNLTAVGNTLFFTANDGVNGQELWKSDGTTEGTMLVKDIFAGNGESDIRYLTAVGNTLYFRANDGIGGSELWKSDGTEDGTVRVKDILPGISGSDIRYLTAVGNTLYFRATNGTFANGRELWKSDGTSAGTVLVKDIMEGGSSSLPKELTAIGNTLYFTADDGINGEELWKSDGTVTGTMRISDIRSGFNSSNILELTVVNSPLRNLLYFRADDGINGDELWVLDTTQADDEADGISITLMVSPSSVTEDGSSNLIYTFTRTGSTTNPLTVNYRAGGTATPGIHYSGIRTAPGTKSITFAAGSATATVTVDPTANRSQDTNKTVSLGLLEGAGYTIGTTSDVSGTILNDDLIGTSARNTIVGTALAEFIDGLQSSDTLTGRGGPDVFGFRYSHSTLTAPDRVTDFRFGTDKVDIFTSSGGNLAAPTGFTRASTNNTATTLAALATAVFTDANGALAGKQALGANKAALVVATKSSIRGAYLFINDGNAGRNNSTDLLINLTGHSGTLPGLGVIPVGSVFA